jgi:hypothetical protein
MVYLGTIFSSFSVGLTVIRYFNLQTWSSEISSTCALAWKPHRVVSLPTVFSLDTSSPYHRKYAVRLLCVFEDKEVVFVKAKEGVFD